MGLHEALSTDTSHHADSEKPLVVSTIQHQRERTRTVGKELITRRSRLHPPGVGPADRVVNTGTAGMRRIEDRRGDTNQARYHCLPSDSAGWAPTRSSSMTHTSSRRSQPRRLSTSSWTSSGGCSTSLCTGGPPRRRQGSDETGADPNGSLKSDRWVRLQGRLGCLAGRMPLPPARIPGSGIQYRAPRLVGPTPSMWWDATNEPGPAGFADPS